MCLPYSVALTASWESTLDLLSQEAQVCLSVCQSWELVLSPDRIILAHSCQGLLNCSRKCLPFHSNNASRTQHLVWRYIKIEDKNSPPFPLNMKATVLLSPYCLPPCSNKKMQSRRNLFWTNSAKQFNNAILYKNT